MRFLLVGPDQEENLSIRYLASALKRAGHHADLAAFNVASDLPAVVDRARGYDRIGLSICFQVRAREFLDLAAAIAATPERPPIIAGGHFATCAARELLEHAPAIHAIVLHEGEDAIVSIADGEPFENIPGLLWREGDRLVASAQGHARDHLDSLAFPDRTGKLHLFAGVPTSYVMGSRGCVANCDYCCITTLHRTVPGRRFRQRDPENVADEMAAEYHGRGIRQFIFHDDNFLVPSVERNLDRIESFARAWRARGMTELGFTIKCRPPDADRRVFARLVELGLLRVFFGIESSSSAGLASIGRRQSVEQNEDALALARSLGLSVQYTIMAFHPDATKETVRSDIAFMRRHVDCALDFCRAEIYAGTPLLERMTRQGRTSGDWLAHTYTIGDPHVQLASAFAMRIFRERAWAFGGLMERVIGMDHLSAVLGRFYPPALVDGTRSRIRDWRLEANHALINLLEEETEACFASGDARDPALQAHLGDLVDRERAGRRVLLARWRELYAEIDRVVLPATGVERRGARLVPSPIRPAALARHATAVLVALSLGCGALDHLGVTEYAAPPLEDSDGDGLPDLCETTVFGTDPDRVDSDGDGTLDGDEDSNGDGISNLAEQEAVGPFECPTDTGGD